MLTPILPFGLRRLFGGRHLPASPGWFAGVWRWQPRRPRRIDLAAGQLWTGRGLAGRRLRVLRGEVWLTEEAGADDWFLRAGEGQVLQRSGCVIASAEGTQPVQLELT